MLNTGLKTGSKFGSKCKPIAFVLVLAMLLTMTPLLPGSIGAVEEVYADEVQTISAVDAGISTGSGMIYANGNPIIISQGAMATTLTSIYVSDGALKAVTLAGIAGNAVGGYDLSGYTIYGGGKATPVSSTSITMTGGEVHCIYAGGDHQLVEGNTNVEISNGTVNGYIYGGGTGTDSTVTGGTNVTISGGTVGKGFGGVYGGSGLSGGAVTGDTNVTISGGKVSGDVYGGSSLSGGAVTGDTNVTISGGKVSGDVYGGSSLSGGDVNGGTSIKISGNGMVYGSVYGGGVSGLVKGDTSIKISDGAVGGFVYGGGYFGAVTGGTSIKISGGTVKFPVCGGGFDESSTVTGGTSIEISGGTVNSTVFGGGYSGDVTSGTSIKISGGTVNSTVFGGGHDNNSDVTGGTSIEISGGTVGGSVYGGGGANGGDVTGGTSIGISGGTVKESVYGGGHVTGSTVTGDTNVSISGDPAIGTAEYGIVISGTGITNGVDSFNISDTLTGTPGSIQVVVPAGLADNAVIATATTAAVAEDGASKLKLVGSNVGEGYTAMASGASIIYKAPYDYTLYYNSVTGKMYKSHSGGTYSDEVTGLSGWTGEGETLTLNGFEFITTSPSALEVPGGTSIVIGAGGANLRSIYGNGMVATYGLYCSGNLSTSGGGILTAAAAGGIMSTGNSYGIYTMGTYTNSGTVTATGGNSSGNYSYGIFVYGSYINNGTVTATGGTALNSQGIGTVGNYTNYGTVTATGGMVLTGGSYGIGTGGNYTNNGTVTATGGNASNGSSYGIYGKGSYTNSGTTTATGGTVSTGRSHGIYFGGAGSSNSAVNTGGVTQATGGMPTELNGRSYGIFGGGNPTISVTGGKVIASYGGNADANYAVWAPGGITAGTATGTDALYYDDTTAGAQATTFKSGITKAIKGAVTLGVKTSSGGGSPSYDITESDNIKALEKAGKGTVTVSPERARAGSQVTITVIPNTSYDAGTPIVKDKDGKKLELKDKGNGVYTFIMPSGGIEIDVDIAPIFQPKTVTPNFNRAVLSTQHITLNGSNIEGITAYNVDGYNYVKLRDVAMVLKDTKAKFNIEVGAGYKVIMKPGQDYVPVGGELVQGADKSTTCVVSNWTVTIDGIERYMNVYNIGGNNYYKLRDICTLLGIEIAYDEQLKQAQMVVI